MFLSPFRLCAHQPLAVLDCRRFGVAVLTFAVLVCRRFDHLQPVAPAGYTSGLSNFVSYVYSLYGAASTYCVDIVKRVSVYCCSQFSLA